MMEIDHDKQKNLRDSTMNGTAMQACFMDENTAVKTVYFKL